VTSRWLRQTALAVPALLAMAGAAWAAGPAAPSKGPATGQPLDAEFLRDLDLLDNPDYSRDREVAKRMRLLERLRVLESFRALENQTPATPATPAGQTPPAGSARRRCSSTSNAALRGRLAEGDSRTLSRARSRSLLRLASTEAAARWYAPWGAS